MDSKDSTSLETYRHQCEVRWILKMSGKSERRDYLDLVRKRRGQQSANVLERDVMNQWKKGNRGSDQVWL